MTADIDIFGDMTAALKKILTNQLLISRVTKSMNMIKTL